MTQAQVSAILDVTERNARAFPGHTWSVSGDNEYSDFVILSVWNREISPAYWSIGDSGATVRHL